MPKACAVLDGPEVSMTVLGDEVDTGVSAPSARPVLPQPHAAKVVPVDRVVRQELPADALKLPAPPNRVGVKSAQKITERSRGQPFTRAARRSSATISATSDIRTAISVPARQLPGGQVWRPGGYRGRRGDRETSGVDEQLAVAASRPLIRRRLGRTTTLFVVCATADRRSDILAAPTARAVRLPAASPLPVGKRPDEKSGDVRHKRQ
jgi:hypothetical protein